jgi:hypothetical protein
MSASIDTTRARDGFLVNDMRCVSCGHGRLEHRHEDDKPATIVCQSCGREYGQSFGVHFFGDFERSALPSIQFCRAHEGDDLNVRHHRNRSP